MRKQTLNSEWLFKTLASKTTFKRFWVAFSGGVDSRVLLELCAKVFRSCNDPSYQFSAVHIHHGLSPNADEWVSHCKEVCANLEIPLQVIHVNATVTDGSSPEEIARVARYEAFENFLSEGDCLLLAHHACDQAETILLRLFRGTGPLGLGGMPEKGHIGKTEFLRPMLAFSKEAILNYAKAENYSWIEDESNVDTRFDRNFLRREILPKLTARWPSVLRSVSRAGSLCLEAASGLQDIAVSDYASSVIQAKQFPSSLNVRALLALDPLRRKGVLRYWLQCNGFSMPSLDHMDRIEREVLGARPDRHPKLKIADYEISRSKGELKVRALQESLCP